MFVILDQSTHRVRAIRTRGLDSFLTRSTHANGTSYSNPSLKRGTQNASTRWTFCSIMCILAKSEPRSRWEAAGSSVPPLSGSPASDGKTSTHDTLITCFSSHSSSLLCAPWRSKGPGTVNSPSSIVLPPSSSESLAAESMPRAFGRSC